MSTRPSNQTLESATNAPQVKRDINGLLTGNTKLSVADIDRIANERLSPLGPLAQIDKVGEDLAREVDRIVNLIAGAAGNAATYQADLADAHHELERSVNRDAIKELVQSLVQSTSAMEQRNQALETALRVSKQVIDNLQRDVDNIRHESLTDPLTSLANRKHFEITLRQFIEEAANNSTDAFSLLLIDIDHFKQFNDNHGHQVGDEVLRLLARHLKSSLKGQDVAARYGGEEFAVLLPNTSLKSAKIVAENIRTAVAGKIVRKRSTGESLGQVTVSIGVVDYRRGEDSETLIGRADTLLYAAKNAGRNAVHS